MPLRFILGNACVSNRSFTTLPQPQLHPQPSDPRSTSTSTATTTTTTTSRQPFKDEGSGDTFTLPRLPTMTSSLPLIKLSVVCLSVCCSVGRFLPHRTGSWARHLSSTTQTTSYPPIVVDQSGLQPTTPLLTHASTDLFAARRQHKLSRGLTYPLWGLLSLVKPESLRFFFSKLNNQHIASRGISFAGCRRIF